MDVKIGSGELPSGGRALTRKSNVMLAVILAVRVAGISASTAILTTRPLKLFAQIGPIIGIKPTLNPPSPRTNKQTKSQTSAKLKRPDQSTRLVHIPQTILKQNTEGSGTVHIAVFNPKKQGQQ